MSVLRSALACAAVLATLAVASHVAAQARVIPPGKEARVLDIVREAFGETPVVGVAIVDSSIRVDTGEGAILVATAGAPGNRITVSIECEACDDTGRRRWSPLAERLRASLTASKSELWTAATVPRDPPIQVVSAPANARYVSWLVLFLVIVGLLGAPRAKGSVSSRRSLLVALLGVAAFAVVALSLSPRPLHDHLCFVERAWCASTLRCDVVHGAWGRPTFHLMGLLLAAVPHRLPWILGVGVGLTALALFFVFDVTSRVAHRLRAGEIGLADRAGEAGLWAMLLVALHPGFLRVAGAGSFWPLTLLLLLVSFHLLLRAGDTPGPRQTLAFVAAGGAFALALGANRLVLVLAPLLVLTPWAWKSKVRPAHLLALVLPMGMFVLAASDVLGASSYDAWRTRSVGSGFFSVLRVPYRGALSWYFTAPPVGAIALVALASRRRFRGALPFAYAFVALTAAALHFAGPMDWRAYPDIYIKHFPQLVLIAPLFGIGALVVTVHLRQRWPRWARFVVPVGAAVLLLGAWTRPDARNLLFEERVMERELEGLQAAFDTLPAHDEIVTVLLSPPPPGIAISGDPLEMHFPTGLYEAAMEARGMTPAPVTRLDLTRLDALSERAADSRILLHVGGILRSFYPDEISGGRVPSTLERPEVDQVRSRFEMEAAHVFEVSTREPRGVGNRVAPGAQTVELGFHWIRPR